MGSGGPWSRAHPHNGPVPALGRARGRCGPLCLADTHAACGASDYRGRTVQQHVLNGRFHLFLGDVG